jgi:hypothetical protein
MRPGQAAYTASGRYRHNAPPTYKHVATARCGANAYELVTSEAEGVDATFEYRVIDGNAIIETTLRTGREGEYGSAVSVLVLDFSTCSAQTPRGDE